MHENILLYRTLQVRKLAEESSKTANASSTHQWERQLVFDLEQLIHKWQCVIAGAERSHDLTVVLLQVKRIETWDDEALRRGEHAKDTDLRQTAIIDLGQQTLIKLLARPLRVESERVVEVQGWVWDSALLDPLSRLRISVEAWELAWHATAHVVRIAILLQRATVLAPNFQEANEEEDLNLRSSGQRIPLLWRATCGSDVAEGNVARQLPRENDVIRLDAEADESRHRYAAVLELRVAQESDRRIVTLLPEICFRQVQRVPKTNHWIEFFGQSLQVFHLRRSSTGL